MYIYIITQPSTTINPPSTYKVLPGETLPSQPNNYPVNRTATPRSPNLVTAARTWSLAITTGSPTTTADRIVDVEGLLWPTPLLLQGVER